MVTRTVYETVRSGVRLQIHYSTQYACTDSTVCTLRGVEWYVGESRHERGARPTAPRRHSPCDQAQPDTSDVAFRRGVSTVYR